MTIKEDLYDTDFNGVIGEYTVLDTVETGAIADATSLDHLAICRASNYNFTEYWSPTLTCEEYEEYECQDNDYLDNDSDDIEICLPDEVSCLLLDLIIVLGLTTLQHLSKNTVHPCETLLFKSMSLF